jgi:hypothetical protein
MPVPRRRKPLLYFTDIAVLLCIVKYHDETGKSPHQKHLLPQPDGSGELINKWMAEQGIHDLRYTIGVNSVGGLDGIAVLRRLGFLEPDKFFYVPTKAGKNFVKKFADKDWREWPLHIPITENNTVDLRNSVYLEDLAV